MSDIFLSYNRGDQAFAAKVAHGLEDAGYDVWWDTALRAGQTYDEVTEGKLRAARAVVVLWSHRSVKSKWVRAEATMAENRSRLVPIMIEDCERPLRFELIQTADLIGWTGDREDPRWKDFVEDVHTFVAETAPQPAPAGPTIAETVVAEDDDDEAEEIESVVATPPPAPEPEPAPELVVEPAPVVARIVEPAPPPEPVVAAPPPPEPPPPPPPVVETPPPPVVEAIAPTPEPPPPQPPRPFPRPEELAATPSPRAAAPPPPIAPPPPPPLPPMAAPRAPVHAPQPSPRAAVSGGMSPMLLGAIAIGAVLLVGGLFLQSQGDKPAPDVAAIEAPAVAAPAPVAPSAPETPRAAEKSAAAASPGGPFRDCDACPQMVPVPAGSFLLGSPDTEPQRQPYEGPQQQVTLASFAMAASEVTFAQWDACVADGGCGGYTPADKGWGRGDRPVMSVSWRDAGAYVAWLSRKTGRAYRLPSEAEWEYAARAGTTTAYWWGTAYDPSRTPLGKTTEATRDPANAFGLHHVAGNVREWVQDCYVSGYSAANQSGAPIATGNCNLRVVRGGGYRDRAGEMRIANRGRNAQTVRDSTVGFRVAATL